MLHEVTIYIHVVSDTTSVKDKTDPLFVSVNLNGKQVPMEIDTIKLQRDCIRPTARGIGLTYVYMFW